MTHPTFEGSFFNGEQQAMEQQEIALLASREIFFKSNLTIEDSPLFCTDERKSDVSTYLHAAGGILGIAYNRTIQNEVLQPGSVKSTTFARETASVVPLIKDVAKARPGVHSEVKREGGEDILRVHIDDCDCGYAAFRQAISTSVSENQVTIIDDAKRLLPELFETEADDSYALEVAAAHGRLAGTDSYFTSGRDVLLAGRDAGAEQMVVKGDHDGTAAIYNIVEGQAIDTNQANIAGLSTYSQDAWATALIADRLQDLYPYDSKQRKIAEVIDTIGTWRVLGVKVIAVRRPDSM